MKKISKKQVIIIIYIALLVLGIVLFFICRPYALANREDPTKPGGEYCLIILPVCAFFFGRCVWKDRDLLLGRYDDDDEDDE